MNVVSTLCATTTVGAAAVGYTFGVAPEIDPGTKSPHERPAQRDTRRPRQTSWYRLRPMSELIVPRHFETSDADPTPETVSVNTKQEEETSEKTDCIGVGFGLHLQDRRTRSPPSVGDDSLNVGRRRSRPASWALTQSSSPPSSIRPSSITAFLPQQTSPAPLPPNKLVKRSLSQHTRSSTGDLLTNVKSYKGPATSHQRSAISSAPASQNRRTVSDSCAIINGEEVAEQTQTSRPYHHYFEVGSSSGARALDRRSEQQELGGVGQLRPHTSKHPVLVLGNVVQPPKNTGQTQSNSKQFSRLPGKRASSTNIMDYRFSPPTSPSPVVSSNDNTPSRRSIGDLLSFRTTTDEPKYFRRKLQRPLSQRIISAPPSTTPTQNFIFTVGSDRLQRKGRVVSETIFSDNSQPILTYSQPQSQRSPVVQTSNPDIKKQSEETAVQKSSPRPHPDIRDSPSTILSSSSFDPNRSTSERSRYSMTPSDLASSGLGSEAEGRAFSDEEDADLQSETVYDSVRTGMTRRSGTFSSPRYDKEPSPIVEDELAQNINFHRLNLSSPTSFGGQTDVIDEEDETISTPIQLETDQAIDEAHFGFSSPMKPNTQASPSVYQPTIDRISTNRSPNHHQTSPQLTDDRIGLTSSEEGTSHLEMLTVGIKAQSHAQSLSRWEEGDNELSGQSTPSEVDEDTETKPNVFDWSEHSQVDRALSGGAPRPFQTVHGRRSREQRTSRANGRRAPSGPHARSRSVPVLSDHENHTNVASKFGTWGVGSKGATEDWDEDFDFEDSGMEADNSVLTAKSDELNATPKIIIPSAIREQQTNVLANIGLLKEWGLLIEELKELRLRAAALGIESKQHQDTFAEVDAMIDLADQEHEEDASQLKKARSESFSTDYDLEDLDQFDGTSSPIKPTLTQSTEIHSRPRGNSEAIARSVISAIQQRKTPAQGMAARKDAPPPPAKVPFDKGTLKHILPHLINLVKSLKSILRTAEGIDTSFEQLPQRREPTLSRVFQKPEEEASPGLVLRHRAAAESDTEDWD